MATAKKSTGAAGKKPAPASKAPRKQTPAKKSTPARKAPASKAAKPRESSAAHKPAATKTPAKKTAAKKGPARKAAAESSGRKYSPEASKDIEREMRAMKEGKLTIGKSKKKVTNPKQAIAIGLAEARREGEKVPPNPNDPKGS